MPLARFTCSPKRLRMSAPVRRRHHLGAADTSMNVFMVRGCKARQKFPKLGVQPQKKARIKWKYALSCAIVGDV